MSVAGLLLAAGQGTRFGHPKALVTFKGELLVERGARLMSGAGLVPVLVVLGASAPAVLERARLSPAQAVVNVQWPEGVGSSLRAGLAALETWDEPRAPGRDCNIEAVLIALADQPFVSARLLSRLVDAWAQGAAAAVATFGGEPRNPVVLDRSIWEDTKSLAVGDVGARGYLRRHPELVKAVPCDDVGSPFDIDAPSDLGPHDLRD